MWLTFDWDDVNPTNPIVQTAMEELVNEFGDGFVWYRLSSSGNGLHLIIARLEWREQSESISLKPLDFPDEKVVEWRQKFHDEPWNLECCGRLITDAMRRMSGTTWGRIFKVKNSSKVGEWLPC